MYTCSLRLFVYTLYDIYDNRATGIFFTDRQCMMLKKANTIDMIQVLGKCNPQNNKVLSFQIFSKLLFYYTLELPHNKLVFHHNIF